MNPPARSVSPAPLLALGLVFALGSCASHAPLTPSTETAANSCEAVLANDPNNCGACGVRCAGPNGESACLGGTCRMVYCIPGHCDLDGDPKNGCEARTKGCRVNKE
ncbi:MAG: hypothetical protein WDO74_16400 [Pseudomonadota bacterium]